MPTALARENARTLNQLSTMGSQLSWLGSPACSSLARIMGR